MRKALLLLALILCCSFALAQSHPGSESQPSDLQSLEQAISSPNANAQPRIALCSPPTNDVCVDKNCQCVRFTCSHCGVKSFTCNESTGKSICVCKTC
jgi:hypothetical protein